MTAGAAVLETTYTPSRRSCGEGRSGGTRRIAIKFRDGRPGLVVLP